MVDKSSAEYWADWLVDAVAGATQDRRYLRGTETEDTVATAAIYLNGRKAIENFLKYQDPALIRAAASGHNGA